MIRSRQGFTLIELIATIAVSSVMVALFLPLVGSSLEGNRRLAFSGPQAFGLRSEMDSWWHLYRSVYPDDIPALSSAIAAAAVSSPPPAYSVLYNGWVNFDSSGVEYIPAAGTENVLRVTLGNSEGQELTAYFFPIP
jgi:prepilin-type N-terminal cleavage/methylation domain-containing protein